MNAEEALYIQFPMIALPIGFVVAVLAAFRRSSTPILWFNVLFGLASVPLLLWTIASMVAEVASWHRDQPDLPIQLAQFPDGLAVALIVEIILIAAAYACLRRNSKATRIASLIGFAVNLSAACLPLALLLALTIWPITRLF